MRKIKALKEQRIPKEYMTDEDFNRLVNGLDKSYFSEHRDYAMIVLMLDTGMRLGECSCLFVEDVDLTRNRIYLKADITKGRKDRVVYFSDKTERILRAWLRFKDRYINSDYIFPSRTSKSHVTVSSFETNFRRYLNRFNIRQKLSPHCLRNNFAKRCLMNGMDIYTLSRLLGHSSVTITEQAYLDLNEDDIAQRYWVYSPIQNIGK
jgi:integrase/recombinase XerD